MKDTPNMGSFGRHGIHFISALSHVRRECIEVNGSRCFPATGPQGQEDQFEAAQATVDGAANRYEDIHKVAIIDFEESPRASRPLMVQ